MAPRPWSFVPDASCAGTYHERYVHRYFPRKPNPQMGDAETVGGRRGGVGGYVPASRAFGRSSSQRPGGFVARPRTATGARTKRQRELERGMGKALRDELHRGIRLLGREPPEARIGHPGKGNSATERAKAVAHFRCNTWNVGYHCRGGGFLRIQSEKVGR